ncbi:AI-2E family transporter [Aestuariivirga litoralis]|uniref:AI-2E family transporter n=1 Tax=Aestuariivirga litoralis TaxID=2650924 RepID=A0A2W2CCL3_9HYPH|nr:AI-2E family transporter [Aestuariivirga litoralis]PZF77943.1 AI-2E family transporter [Aestuariivirga litoralis]
MRPLPATVYRENSLGPAPGQGLVNGLIIFLAICAILYAGAEILIPVALAILLSILLAPVVTGLQRLRLPKALAAIVTVVMAALVVAVLAGFVASAVTNLAADLPSYQSSLREKAQNLKSMTTGGGTLERAAGVLESLRKELDRPEQPRSAATEPVKPIPVEIREVTGPFTSLESILSLLIHPLTQLGIIILMLTFFLIYREDLRNRLIRLAGTGDIHRTTTAIDEAGRRLSRLFATQMTINAATGAFIGTALFVIGVPGAALWGTLTMILRFVPYVGTLLAAIFPIIIAAAVGDGWTLALVTLGVVVVTETMVGHVLEPLFFGRSTGLSPVAVVVAAAFWTALWGPVGLVLSTPMTIVLLVVGRHIEALQFLEVLLGSKPVLTPDHAFYQRMLANDPVEAAEGAETYVEEKALDRYLAEVAVPGLVLAQNDKARQVLTEDREVTVVSAYSELLEELWPEGDAAADAASPVVVIAGHGALNFAAALSLSAFLRLKGVPHRLLPPDAVQPGKFPDGMAEGAAIACLCYLTAPSEARYSYVEKRIAQRMPGARILGVAWREVEDARSMLAPEHALALLPSADLAHATETPRSSPELTVATR